MEKKKYVTPEMKEYAIENEGALLAGSSGNEGNETDEGEGASLYPYKSNDSWNHKA